MRVLAILLLLPLLAGCTTQDDSIQVAFVTKDTATAPHEDLDRLAQFMAQHTGRQVDLAFATDAKAALEAVRFGQADVASVDGFAGWLAWKQHGLDAIASEIRSDGRTHYIASAWVRADSDIKSVADLEGRTSCHTGATKSAGMMMPLSYLIKEGLIDASQYEDDVTQLPRIARDFFHAPIIPEGGPYSGYDGALRCLSDGTGEVAFIRDTTPADYCASDKPDWCLPLDDYDLLVEFGPIPEHPFMVSRDLDDDKRADILAALLALNDRQDILEATFGTGGIQEVTAQSHLGDFGALIENLPGIHAYAQAK